MESRHFYVQARGDLACFTRPELKVERVSYDVMTPSAARGIIECVLWKPAIRWHVHSIAVLAPVRWTSIRRNEVKDLASPRVPCLITDDPDQRSQRNTLALRDVNYVVECSFEMTARAGEGDNVIEFTEMLERRLKRGQCFRMPCLGMREFAADVGPAPRAYRPIDPGVDRPLGQMFFGFAGDVGRSRPMFFEARLKNGVMHVPSLAQVRLENDIRVPA